MSESNKKMSAQQIIAEQASKLASLQAMLDAANSKRSASSMLREIICNNPALDLKALRLELSKRNIAMIDSTLSTLRSDTLATISAARASKHWVD